MFRKSIRQKIVGIAAGLIVLAVITSLLSMIMAGQVGHLLGELTSRYIPAYAHLARVNVRSLERSLAMRRMMMAKTQGPVEDETYAAARKTFDEINPIINQEADAARKLIVAIINDPSTPSDNAALGRIDDRIDNALNDLLPRLNTENQTLLDELDAKDFVSARKTMARAEGLRDDFNSRIEGIRADMLAQVSSSAKTVMSAQQHAIMISAAVTAIAAVLGFVFAMLVGSGITGPVMRLLEGTREVEAGRLDGSITITTQDEIGQLSAAFNRMIETLRHNQRIRETFGRYINPRIAEGLLDQPAIAATEGQRRVMTVVFCDMKGFTTLSEGVTPRGLVKIMNLYLSTMSEPIHAHRGIIDKYIGDAIMAYWGAPFVEETEQTHLASLAAIDMIGRVTQLRKELPELLGVRAIPTDCDIRIGIATGEALVGSIGSEFMMSYTVLGDTVNLASRLEGANKFYGSRCLISEATAAGCSDTIELREIDRLVVVGQSQPQTVFDILGKKDELTEAQTELRRNYAEGLAAYRERRWDEAEQALAAALAAVPDDGPSIALKARVEGFRQTPPPADWDGARHLEHK
ncbi:HAMP domain-containing protein [Bradyrhizobium jicamae]|uniref:HAMP domain-containing protein n=1 Tax=Bradyrhizobium jicamae TaxID=280332 RepID=A0ABS5FY53_9BRAD|nr:adenylate/guanylate cyclase domain-containing protein [Bradyrhizobium jicamae]MBR0801717.1 HAMP domain-containing protein [Bradyrhizobium jicamae]MBR0934768.1 HAMP domain-containing protein [Bradyrhizobium jicamae]